MAKTQITKATVDTAAYEAEVDVRDDYSGRGMYGETCWGVVGVTDSLCQFENELAKAATVEQYDGALEGSIDVESVLEVFSDKLTDIRRARREDSMGMDRIFYYPSIELVD